MPRAEDAAAAGAAQVAVLQDRLLEWYAACRRDLPWRRTRDPYAIWVSEVMLQQTRVETVIPRYERFLSRFPTVLALAEAPADDVLAAWSGLGYYRRARLLHEGARELVRGSVRGEMPSRRDDLLQVRGIGRYTAGAIASIAFSEPVGLVDGNVARVLARLFAIDDDMRRSAGVRRAQALADAIVARRDPSAWNQALMELGATVARTSCR
jgi:A/G-specific adenine glycosylase